MKIFIYAHLFPPSLGGMQYQNLAIAKGLKSLGHDVHVVACNNRGLRRFAKSLNFSVDILPKWPFAPMHSLGGISRLNWIFIPYYGAKISQLIARVRPDVILLADESSNFLWGPLAGRCIVPYVSYCSVPHLPIYRRRYPSPFSNGIGGLSAFLIQHFLKSTYEKSCLLLVVSTSTRNEIIKQLPQLAPKMSIVPNSIDDRFFDTRYSYAAVKELKHKLHIEEDDFVLLSVTRLTIDKGVDDVVKTLSILEHSMRSKVKYVVMGQGRALHYLQDLVRTLNLCENVVFTGAIPHYELIPYYDLCDVFILPPRRGPHESFGRVFVEAAARRKPSVASREGGMLDVIDDGITGFLVSPGDKQMIRDRIISLIDDRNLRNKLGIAARLKAERLYRPQGVALQFEHHLNSVINEANSISKPPNTSFDAVQ